MENSEVIYQNIILNMELVVIQVNILSIRVRTAEITLLFEKSEERYL